MNTETAIEVFEGEGGTVTEETEVKFTKGASLPLQTQPIDWESLRNDFPILHQKVHGHPLVYFDNAATSQKPKAVLEALRRYYENDNANVHRGIHELSSRGTAAFEAARVRAAKFLNALSADEIIFTRRTTEDINLAAASCGAKF